MSTTLAERLSQVVGIVFAGNVHQAAQAGGVPTSTLHRILEGQVEDPRIGTLRRLAEGFGVSVGWLTGEVDDAVEFREAPTWKSLILRYNETRQRPLRAALAGATTKAGKRLAATYAELNWLERKGEGPIPEPHLIFEDAPRQGDDDRTALLRQVGELETAILNAAVRRLSRMEATGDKPTKKTDREPKH